MSDDVLIEVDHVSKKFCRNLKRSLWYGVRDIGTELLGCNGHHGDLRPGEFWAVDDVSFQVRRGECLGLIGRNGAGKSTLLKMLNGLIKPDIGRITIRGRVGGLIALGAGFNPILTGRENIYNNAAVLGIAKRDADQQLDAILEFAELDGGAIDAPVQTYSSGMQVRLGFAIAAILVRPDVLLLDEVLAVGDIGFVIKCLNAVRTVTEESATVFVSHGMQFVSMFCNHIIVLKRGAIICNTDNVPLGIDTFLAQFTVTAHVSGTGEAAVRDIRLSVGPEQSSTDGECVIAQGDSLELDCTVEIHAQIGEVDALLVIKNHLFEDVIACPVLGLDAETPLRPGRQRVTIEVGHLDLSPGKYSFMMAIIDGASKRILTRVQGVGPFRVIGPQVHWAPHSARSAFEAVLSVRATIIAYAAAPARIDDDLWRR